MAKLDEKAMERVGYFEHNFDYQNYSVVLKNNDVSIGFRKKGNVLTDRNPQIKVEYRASFLVKNGLHGAHKILNDFILLNLLLIVNNSFSSLYGTAWNCYRQ